MATAPPAKKQKVAKPPVIFKSFGMPADVRFTVFDEEFHVHSMVLKTNSAFFCKFLHPVNKNGASVAAGHAMELQHGRAGMGAGTSRFQYEWVSQLDVDGKDWHLVYASGNGVGLKLFLSHPRNTNPSRSRLLHIPAVQILIRSVNSKPFVS